MAWLPSSEVQELGTFTVRVVSGTDALIASSGLEAQQYALGGPSSSYQVPEQTAPSSLSDCGGQVIYTSVVLSSTATASNYSDFLAESSDGRGMEWTQTFDSDYIGIYTIETTA